MPVQDKCGFTKQGGNESDPAKKILRILALKLGLTQISREKKRAIQFGARTARMELEKGRRKGTDVLT